MAKVQKVIIPVGGFGTRFLPATKAQPKEMLPIVDKPVIQYLVEEAVKSGIRQVVLVTGRAKRAIEDHFDHSAELEHYLETRGKSEIRDAIRKISSLASIVYVRQKEQRGIVDAIMQARPWVGDEPFAVMSGDDIIDSVTPALKQLIRIYERYRSPVVALKKVSMEEISKYGVISGKKVAARIWRVSGSVEKPDPAKAPSNMMIVVKYIFTPEIWGYFEKVRPAPNGELYIPPAIDAYTKKGGRFYGYEVNGNYYDCGDKLGYLKAVVNYGLKHSDVGKEFKRHLRSLKI